MKTRIKRSGLHGGSKSALSTALILLLLLMASLVFSGPPAHASTTISITTSNGSTVCPASPLSGSWVSSTHTCTITVTAPDTVALVIASGSTLDIGAGVTISVTDDPSSTACGCYDGAQVNSGGTINNYGTMTATTSYYANNAIGNTGTINNYGTMTGIAARNVGIVNEGGTINNYGTMQGTNTGAGAGPYGINNGGGSTINNDGTMSGSGTSYGINNGGTINDYCGVTLSGTFSGTAPNSISCYTVTFDQSGIPTSGVTWGVTASWGPLPSEDHTGTGASIQVQLTGSLTYSYDTPVTGSGTTYNCGSGCSGTASVSGATTLSASYVSSEPAYCTTIGGSWDGSASTCTFSSSSNYNIASGTLEITSGTLAITGNGALSVYCCGANLQIDNGATVSITGSGGQGGIYSDGTNGQGVDNLGTIVIANTGGYGIYIDSRSTITNSGTITIRNTGGTGIYNGHAFNNEVGGTVSVCNTGSSTGIDNGGTVTNDGTISKCSTGTYSGTSPSGNPIATTTASCSPSSVDVGSPTTCTATVTGSSPTGTVTFSTSVGATSQFSSTTCTLSSGSCQVDYTPSSSTSPVTIKASYGGDSSNAASSDTFSLTINTALTAPSAPTASATSIYVSQTLTVTDTIPSTGTSAYAWTWLASTDGGSTYSTATQCATSSGTGASAGATETCSIAANALTAGDTYLFELKVTDGAGASKTSSASSSVTVYSNPSVSVSPSSAAIDADGTTSATFTATASGGSGGYSYTWTVSSGLTEVSGCASSSTICKVTSTTAGSDTVSVTVADSNTVASSAVSASITVNAAMSGVALGSFTFNPLGPSTSDSVTVSWSGGTTSYVVTLYQSSSPTSCSSADTQVDQVSSVSGTSKSMSFASPSSPGTYYYCARVADSLGETASSSASGSSLTVSNALSAGIISPSSPSIDPSQSVVLTANPAGGTGTYTAYKWYTSSDCSTSPITGAAASTYSASPSSTTTYYVKVTDSASSTACSSGDTVTVDPALTASPSATADPVVVGQPTTVSAHASGGSGSYTSYTWSGLPSGCSSFAASFTCTPTSRSGSPYTVQVVVADSNGNSVTETFSLTVSADTPGTSVSCSPSSVVVDSSTTCTATVSGFSPTGSLSWSTGGSGSFSANSCTLASGGCSVSYTPGSSASPVTIMASYGGDSNNAASSGTFSLAVALQSSATSVSCSPSSVDVGSSTICTATVTGLSPTGAVSFASGGVGTFSPSSCSLSSGSCSVDYTPSGSGSQSITGSYGGDSNNGGSTSTSFHLTALAVGDSVLIAVTGSGGSSITDATVTLNGDSQLTGLSGVASFSVQAGGPYALTVSAPGYASYSSTVSVASYTTSLTVTLNPLPADQTFSDPDGSYTSSGGFVGVSVPFTNDGATSQTVNVWFVWYNSANQVVNIGEEIGVAFGAGQALTFTGTYDTSGTYTVKVFITDANSNALSSSYSTTVTVP